MLGPLATTLCAKFSCRVTTMIGCTVAAAGCLTASFSTAMWQMNLTYGFLFGFGASMCYFPSVVILGQYFWKRLSLANGITSSGSGVGTLAMGPILQKLLEHFGLRNTMRISAGMIICVWLCALIYRPVNTGFIKNKSEDDENPEKKCKGPRFPALQIFKNKAYILWCVALSFWMLGYFVPFVHLVSLIGANATLLSPWTCVKCIYTNVHAYLCVRACMHAGNSLFVCRQVFKLSCTMYVPHM